MNEFSPGIIVVTGVIDIPGITRIGLCDKLRSHYNKRNAIRVTEVIENQLVSESCILFIDKGIPTPDGLTVPAIPYTQAITQYITEVK